MSKAKVKKKVTPVRWFVKFRRIHGIGTYWGPSCLTYIKRLGCVSPQVYRKHGKYCSIKGQRHAINLAKAHIIKVQNEHPKDTFEILKVFKEKTLRVIMTTSYL